MAKVLVLYYSAYGHIETMANAVAEGAREAGAKVDIKRVPEIVPEEMARAVAAGVDAHVDVWMGMFHGFPASIGKFKAAAKSLDAVGTFLTDRLRATNPPSA